MRRAFLLLALSACTASLPSVPAPSPDEGGRRQQELDWLVSALERRHPDIHSVTPPDRFEDEVAAVRAGLPDATTAEAFVGLLRIVALVGDSHTRLENYAPVEERVLPVMCGAWPEGWWITAVQPGRSDLFACKVLAIEGRSVEECAQTLAPLVPHENAIVLRQGVARLMTLPQVLAAVGLADDDARIELALRDPSGAERTVELEALPREQLEGWTAIAPQGWSNPLYRSRMDQPWWWTELDGGQVLYFQYNRCAETPEQPFVVQAAEILERLDRGDVERLVIDLRHNGGGDSRVLRPLITGLTRRRAWRGGERIVVLIGNSTYSSAQMNALVLQRDLGARLLGEPTAQKPNSFGEMRFFRLPFSGLEVGCSTRTYRQLDDDPPSLEPDVLVPTTFDDLYRGRDPLLDAVLGEHG